MSGIINNTRINVAIRIRPLIKREIDDNANIHWVSNGNHVKQIDPLTQEASTGSYNFDNVFGISSQTDEIYSRIVSPIILKAFQGFNGTIFCYGQTSSGKTYTLYGDEERNQLGFIHFMSDQLFEISKDGNYMIKVGILEIYNEHLSDMLEPKNKVEIKEIDGVVTPTGMKEIPLFCKEDLDKLIVEINSKRIVGETNMNTKSSRSHTIVRLTIEKASTPVATKAFLNLVDLAGSEKVGQSGAEGQRFKEGMNINASLSALSKVFHELSQIDNNSHCVGSTSPPLQGTSFRQSFSIGSESQSMKAPFKAKPKSRFVNFRDSKLTRILQSSLQGNAYIIMICSITPASIDETSSTLRFAKQAKSIKVEPELNILPFNKRNKEEYEKIIEEFKTQLIAKDEEKGALQRRLEHVMRFCGSNEITELEMKPPINRRQTVCGTELRNEGKHPSQIVFNQMPKTFDIFDKPKDNKADISGLFDTSEEGISGEKFQSHSDTINYFSRKCEFVDSSDDSLEIPKESILPAKSSGTDNRKREGENLNEGLPAVKKFKQEPDETPVKILRIQRGVLRAEVEYQGIEYEELRNFHKMELEEKSKEIEASQQYNKELEDNISKAYSEMQEIKKSMVELQSRLNEDQEKFKELQKNKEFEVDIMNQEVQKKNKIIAQLKESLNQASSKTPTDSIAVSLPISTSSQTDDGTFSPLEFSLKAIEAECQTEPGRVLQSHQSLDPITWDSFQMDRDCQTDIFATSVYLDQALDPIVWDKPQLDQESQTEDLKPQIVQSDNQSQTEIQVIHAEVDAIVWEVMQNEEGSQTETFAVVHQGVDPIFPIREIGDHKSCQTEEEMEIKPEVNEIECQTDCNYKDQGSDPICSKLADQASDPIVWEKNQSEMGCQVVPSIIHQASDPINWADFMTEKFSQTQTSVVDLGLDPISWEFSQFAKECQTELKVKDQSLDPISWEFTMFGKECQTDEKNYHDQAEDPVIWEAQPVFNSESQTEIVQLMDKSLDPVYWQCFQKASQTETKVFVHQGLDPILWKSTNVEKSSQTPQKNVFHKAVDSMYTWKYLEDSFGEKMRLKDVEISRLKESLMKEKLKAEESSKYGKNKTVEIATQAKPIMTHRSTDASDTWELMKKDLHNSLIYKKKAMIDFQNFRVASDEQIKRFQLDLKKETSENVKLNAKNEDLRKLIAKIREEHERAKEDQNENGIQCDLLMELVEQSKKEDIELFPWIPNVKKLEKEITSLKLSLNQSKRDVNAKVREEVEKEKKKLSELYSDKEGPPKKKFYAPPQVKPPQLPVPKLLTTPIAAPQLPYENPKYSLRYNASRHCAMASRGLKVDVPSTSSLTNGKAEVPSIPPTPLPEPQSSKNGERGERMTRSTSRKSISKLKVESSVEIPQSSGDAVNGELNTRPTRKSLRKSNPRTNYNLFNLLDDEEEDESFSDMLLSLVKK